MIHALARVCARFLVLLALSSMLIFVVLRAAPGNPARVALGVSASNEDIAQLSAALGLDRPLLVQYWDWVSGLLRGDFGVSLVSQENITPLVLDRAQVSLILVGLAMALSLLIAVPVGTWLAYRQAKPDAAVLSGLVQLGIAVPSFLLAIVLVAIFAVHLGWLPAGGWLPPKYGFGGFLSHLVLPVFSLALVQAAILTRYVRSAVLEVIEQDYLRTARASGDTELQALRRHGLRNATLPVLTVAGVQLATLIASAVVIERVFVIPGLSSMLLDAVHARDLPTVQSLVMVLVFFTLVVTLVVDLAYRIVDPRLRRNSGVRNGVRNGVRRSFRRQARTGRQAATSKQKRAARS